MLRGFPLDHCLTFGAQCDQPAADVFCASQGFSKATGFAVQDTTHTEILTGKYSTCGGSFYGSRCGAFTFVTCQK